MVSFMKKENDLLLEQNIFIEKMRKIASDFVSRIDKVCIQTVLLSGSVARGDFSPEKYGGMIDFVVMKKPECVFSVSSEPEFCNCSCSPLSLLQKRNLRSS